MKYRRNPTRPDRSSAPHSRIPDSIYFEVLPFLKGNEVKLWLALKSREWRKDGTRRGLVKKTLNRIARDIRMSRDSVQRAFRGLKMKGLVEWAGFGIRLLEPDFTTAVTTGFTTGVRRRGRPETRPGVAVFTAGSDSVLRPAATVIPFAPNESGCGRSDLTIRRARAARAEPARAVDIRNDFDHHAPEKARARPFEDSRALPSNTPSKRKDEADVSGENDSTEKLKVEKIDRERLREILQKAREHTIAAAEEAAAVKERNRALEEERANKRRELLRQQAVDLLAEEKTACPPKSQECNTTAPETGSKSDSPMDDAGGSLP